LTFDKITLLFIFSAFFFLEKKEPKIQDEMPTPIFFSLKSQRNATEKIVVRTISPKSAALLPTYDR
jgi:hypothetical protein